MNDQPFITAVADKVIDSGWLSQEIGFEYGDAETDKKLLTFGAVSSNKKLIPDENIYVVGSSLFIVPAGIESNQSTEITLTVSDGVTDPKVVKFNVFVRKALNAQFAGGPIQIVDNNKGNPYGSPVEVRGLKGGVSKVTVSLSKLTHRYPGDIDVLLVGPNGKGTVAFSDAGGGRPVSEGWFNLDVMLPAAPCRFNPTDSIASGVWKPTNYDDTENFPAPAPAKPTAGYSPTLTAAFNGLANPNLDTLCSG